MPSQEQRIFLTPSLPSLGAHNADRIRSLLRGQPVMFAYAPEDSSLKSTTDALLPLGIPSRPLHGLNHLKLGVTAEEVRQRIQSTLSVISYGLSSFAVVASPDVTQALLDAIGASTNFPRIGEAYLLGPSSKRGTILHKGTTIASLTTELRK